MAGRVLVVPGRNKAEAAPKEQQISDDAEADLHDASSWSQPDLHEACGQGGSELDGWLQAERKMLGQPLCWRPHKIPSLASSSANIGVAPRGASTAIKGGISGRHFSWSCTSISLGRLGIFGGYETSPSLRFSQSLFGPLPRSALKRPIKSSIVLF